MPNTAPHPPETVLNRREVILQAHFGRIILLQFAGALCFSVILDGGALLRAYMISLAGYWGAVIVGIARKRTFTRRDLSFLQLGWALLAVICLGLIRV